MLTMQRSGVPIVVSAPSGSGKTTLCQRLVRELPGIEVSISHTTRPPRPGEVHGRDYFFVEDQAFDRMLAEGAFLEWAHVFGHRYGTSRAEVQARLGRGTDVLFVIDVQGGRQLAERLPGALLVFVVPPDMTTLEGRLRGRNSDHEKDVSRRLAAVRHEIEQAARLYPFWIVNDDLERATGELAAVVRSERLRRVDKELLLRSFLGGSKL